MSDHHHKKSLETLDVATKFNKNKRGSSQGTSSSQNVPDSAYVTDSPLQKNGELEDNLVALIGKNSSTVIRLSDVRVSSIDESSNNIENPVTLHDLLQKRQSERENLKKNAIFDVTELEIYEKNIEEGILLSETELLFKTEVQFLRSLDQTQLNEALKSKKADLRHLQQMQQHQLLALEKSQKINKFRQSQSIDQKIRDLKLFNQNLSLSCSDQASKRYTQKREQIEVLLGHFEMKRQTKERLMIEMQTRKVCDRKQCLDFYLDCKFLKEEERRDISKKYSFLENYMNAVDKTRLEQLREVNLVGLRDLKGLTEMEIKYMDEVHEIQIQQINEKYSLAEVQHSDYITKKMELKTFDFKLKDARIKIAHQREIADMIKKKNEEIEDLRKLQLQRAEKTNKSWESILNRKPEVDQYYSSKIEDVVIGLSFEDFETQTKIQDLTKELNLLEEEREKLLISHEKIVKKNEARTRKVIQTNEANAKAKKELYLAKYQALEIEQAENMINLIQEHQKELEGLKLDFDYEQEVDQMITDQESKALFERKSMATLLDNLSTGVITMSPTGIVTRFNTAAAKMFQYTPAEVIGKNVNILISGQIKVNHDKYLLNYLTTNVKKIVGISRRSIGQRKDKTTFPLDLAVSEVVDNAFHIFTGIVTDLTEILRQKELIRLEEERQKNEIQKVFDELGIYQNRSTQLLEQMLPGDYAYRIMHGETPPPQHHDVCTIFFSDIVGFTSIASKASAMDIVNLLNDLYTYFDAVIDQHDVYKVETIGDAYMVVSGVPTPNGESHAAQIADMALKLLSGIYSTFTARHTGQKLQIRIGLHTGPSVSGIVGTKMPRYCLFGRTVQFASQMESSSSPMRIQISEPTYALLNKTGQYIFEERDHLVQLGVGIEMKTYWLLGKKGFDLPLPNPEDWPVIGHVKG